MQKQPFLVGGGGSEKFEDLGGQGLKNVRTGGLPFGGVGLLLPGTGRVDSVPHNMPGRISLKSQLLSSFIHLPNQSQTDETITELWVCYSLKNTIPEHVANIDRPGKYRSSE